jgi:hypothetical protein
MFYSFEVLDVLFLGLKASPVACAMTKLQFFIEKISFFFSCKFFNFVIIQNPGFVTGSGSALNQRGSTTLPSGRPPGPGAGAPVAGGSAGRTLCFGSGRTRPGIV